MNNRNLVKSIFLGASLLTVGIVFLVLENTFYQTLDKNNVLQESFFMPLGVLAVILGALVILIALLLKWAKK